MAGWSICRVLSYEIRVFALRDKRSLSRAADVVVGVISVISGVGGRHEERRRAKFLTDVPCFWRNDRSQRRFMHVLLGNM